ncbi:MAG: class I SAM-dependent methyltransferase [Pseudomonadota bacterium]
MIASLAAGFLCQICGGHGLEPQGEFASLPRVTSDCKPWPAGGRLAACHDCGAIQKIPDDAWRDEIRRIYGAYAIYQLSEGAEQVVFTAADGIASPRSRVLVDFIARTIELPAMGRLIDIGCGNGAALASFSKLLPRWELYGNELSDKALPELRKIPNFVALYGTADLEQVPGRYDLVSMIHSLEHMPAPLSTLKAAARLLEDRGALFIEVPDIESSPFDLLVADHLCHFSADTLRHLASRAGLAATALTTTVLGKEITFLGRHGDGAVPRPDPAAGLRVARATLAWLKAVLDRGRALSAEGNFGIFGTSISGMWLYGALGGRVDFFVDEDATRIGRRYDGKPILSPRDAPADATVYVPLTPAVSGKVVARLSGLKARFVAPPDWP